MQWPFLRVGKIRFENGFFTANTEDEASIVEKCESFGKHIFPIKYKPKAVETAPAKVEELIEDEIVAALAARAPRVRRGAIGTK